MADIIYSEYLLTTSSIETGDGLYWQNQSFVIGENTSLVNYSSVPIVDISSGSTDVFVCKFDDDSRIPYFKSISGYKIGRVEYVVKYRLIPLSDNYLGSINASLYLSLVSQTDDSVSLTLDIAPKIENGSYSIIEDSGIKTAIFSFDTLEVGCPSYSDLTNFELTASMGFTFDNPNPAAGVEVQFYEIKQVITLREVLSESIISLIDSDAGIERPFLIVSSQPTDRGYFSSGTEQIFNYIIRNDGPSDLVINSISIDTTNITKAEIGSSFPVTIESGKAVNLLIQVAVPYDGYFPNEHVTINSNAVNDPIFVLGFNYNGYTSVETSPLLALYYNESRIINRKTLSLSSVPLNISNIIPIKIYNEGSSSLIINSCTVIGDATISAGSAVFNDVEILPNEFILLNLSLKSFSLGSKSATFVIISNDSLSNPFSFTFTYNVSNQSNLVIYSGSDLLSDGLSVDLGSLDKGKSFTKSYLLKNDGIYKTVIINSISVDSGMSVLGSISFPFSLLPNVGNSLAFNIEFNTESVGIREGDFTIDYTEGSVP